MILSPEGDVVRKLTAAVLSASLVLSTVSLVSAQEDKEKTKVETKANGDYKEKTKAKDENGKYREKTKVKSHHGKTKIKHKEKTKDQTS